MICFVVALPSEARPLIDHYRLKLVPGPHPFKVYEGNEKYLIVSGVGKKLAASATHFLYTYSGNVRNQIWINVGIGGHAKRAVGEGVLAHKITDRASRESWYPPMIIDSSCPTESVLTVDHPETEYQGSAVYEMEASGFYDAATHFSTAELVQCYKIISDNQKFSSREVSAALVQKLIEKNLEALDIILKKIVKLSDQLPVLDVPREELQLFLSRWHFTVSNQHRLRRFLRRIQTLEPKSKIWSPELQASARAKDVLRFLERRIGSLPVRL